MADLAPTAANVVHLEGPSTWGVAGVAITAGQAVYKDGTNGKIYLAIATTLGPSRCNGMIALNSAAAGHDVEYSLPDAVLDLGGGTAGLGYFLSGATAGALSPHTDTTTPASGEYSTLVTICLGSNRHRTLHGAAEVAVA